MTGLRVALVTSEELRSLTPSDRVLAAALEARGVSAEPAVWTDPAVEWRAYDRVIVRSPWDYFQRIDEFLRWIDQLEAASVPLANPPAVLRWNSHKRYLRELEGRGAPVTPSLWLDRGTAPEVSTAAAERGWHRLVIKPAVSGGAWETWVAEAPLGAAEQARLAAMVARADVLVQPFMDVVPADGELSFIFIEGEFTHAVRKRAASGDFRVQEEYGGTFALEPVDEALVAAAQRVLAMTPAPTLYGRVDAIVVGGELLLMELEVVEPDLFFPAAPAAAGRLADAIAASRAARVPATPRVP